MSLAISCVSTIYAAGPADCFAQENIRRSSPPSARPDASATEPSAPVTEPSVDATQPSDPTAQPGAATAEPLPAPVGVAESEPAMPADCQPVPIDEPLWKLNTDILPRDHDGQPVAADKLPFDCARLKPVEHRIMTIDLSCDSCYPHYCDLLNLAHFCHRPLYFNDDSLERCGNKWCCCQPAASAMCFYGGALLMPVRACCQCPCSCVPSGGCCP